MYKPGHIIKLDNIKETKKITTNSVSTYQYDQSSFLISQEL